MSLHQCWKISIIINFFFFFFFWQLNFFKLSWLYFFFQSTLLVFVGKLNCFICSFRWNLLLKAWHQPTLVPIWILCRIPIQNCLEVNHQIGSQLQDTLMFSSSLVISLTPSMLVSLFRLEVGNNSWFLAYNSLLSLSPSIFLSSILIFKTFKWNSLNVNIFWVKIGLL